MNCVAPRKRSLVHRVGLLGFCLVMAALPARAQIVIGQTAGFTGPVGASVAETTSGARLYFDAVNARGGVHGQPIQLISLDDKFDPALALVNARTLVETNKVVALFLTRGTPHTQALVPLLAEAKVPLVGPSTGAAALHEPVNPYIFNVRATYQREAERAVQHLALIGLTRIAILRVDDSFGADAAVGAMRGLTEAKLAPVAVEKFDRSKPNFSAIGPKVASANPQAVIVIASGQAAADAAAAVRAAGSNAQLVTLSNNASSAFIKQMGPNAYGTIVSQVFPNERSLSTPLVKEALGLAQAKKLSGVSPAMMEGFAAAKVMVEALRRAGPNPSREKILVALNSLQAFDLGGMKLAYSPMSHTGLNFADLSIISADGRFHR